MLDKTVTGQVTEFLDRFGSALEDGDVARATEMFQEDCYWRDLVTFTWNIKTMEAREQVSDMLNAQLAATKPSNWLMPEATCDYEPGRIACSVTSSSTPTSTSKPSPSSSVREPWQRRSRTARPSRRR